MKKVLLFLVCAALAFPFLGCKQSGESGYDEEGNLYGRISISGAWAMYPLVVSWAEEFRKEHPKVQIDISAGGAGKGIADVLVNMVDLAMVSRDITPSEMGRNAWFISVAKDAVIPTFNSNNPNKKVILEQGLIRSQFQEIFLTEGPKNWSQFLHGKGEGTINVYTRSDACGAAEIWAYYLGKAQEDLKGIGVYGDPGIADIVKNDRLGVGYNNIAFAYDVNSRLPFPGLAVIPIDLNENGRIDPEEDFYSTIDDLMDAISQARYPSPPARNLFFVSNGKPKNVAVVEFLHWVLTKGQDYVAQAGYVGLSEHILGLQLEKLPPIQTTLIIDSPIE
jgi:phosphate transport system substrate-binding protein